MITTTLTMAYGPRPVRETNAWYLSGNGPAEWLDEVATWDVPHNSVRLLALPHSASQRQVAGALVIVSDGSRPAITSPSCLPYGQLATNFYVPVEGRLVSDVSNAELGSMFSDNYTYVWHPASGLVAFESADHLRIADLLTMEPLQSRVWDRAVPGVAISRQLVSLAPEQALTIEIIWGEAQGDIGTQHGALSDLPPSPLEPPPGWLQAGARQGKRLLARAIRFLTKQAPATSGKPTWIDRLDGWSREQLAHLNAGLNAARNKEIVRLLNMLETDPARGLRYAIPMGRGDAHRGVGRPGGRLTARDPDFRLGNLGGGGAADFWDLSWDYQRQLSERYRELANREIQLGRYRRAAYIFAELLADFDAAAGALVDGGHWREAAVLYQQRLHRPLDAARCLEQGGLWTEAIELYQELEESEKAGDLLSRIDQIDRARQQYRRAVDQHRARGDLLSSARLLEDKLHLVDDAIDELSSAWPDTSQAVECLRKLVQLWGRLGRHASTQRWIADCQKTPMPTRNRLELVNIVADAATDYPDRSVRHQAADCTRVLVSRQLSTAPAATSRTLLAAVGRLVPADRLLGRDCRRYVDQRPAPLILPPASRSGQRKPDLVRTIQLPATVVWQAATSGGNTIFVAGTEGNHLLLIRGSWNELDRSAKSWRLKPYLKIAPIILAADPLRDDFVLVHVMDSANLIEEYVFQPTDVCPVATKAGAIRGMSPAVLAAARTAHGVTWLVEWREASANLLLIALGPNGQQVSTQVVPLPQVSSETDLLNRQFNPFQLHARNDTVYVGAGHEVLVFDKANPVQTIDFGKQVTSVVGSAPKTRTRIAVTFQLGGMICWDSLENGHTQEFASDMPDPVACFTKGGHLIAASEGRCQVYSTQDQRLQLVAELTETGTTPIAVLPGVGANQFAMVSKAGEIRVYRLPS